MNIAIINTLAKSKSIGKIAYGLQQYMKAQGHRAYVFYGARDEAVSEDETDILRIGTDLGRRLHAALTSLLGCEGTYSRRATRALLDTMTRLEIEAACLLNLHAYYLNFPMLFEYLAKRHIKTEYVMLDEYAFLGKCAYSFECEKFMTECGDCPRLRDYPRSLLRDCSNRMFHLKKKSYELVPDCTFVGIQYTVERARRSAITKNCKFAVADEGVDLRGMYYPRETKALREELRIPKGNKVIVTVTPFPDERKGGEYFLRAAARMEARRDITFVHVGFAADVALCPPNCIPIGYVKDQNLLAEYYSLGDLFVHTSMAETIPAACLEALACGTPLLGFNVSGTPTCADAEHGTFVEPQNVDEMVRVIEEAPLKDAERIASCRHYAESRYDAVEYYRKLTDLLTQGKGGAHDPI